MAKFALLPPRSTVYCGRKEERNLTQQGDSGRFAGKSSEEMKEEVDKHLLSLGQTPTTNPGEIQDVVEDEILADAEESPETLLETLGALHSLHNIIDAAKKTGL